MKSDCPVFQMILPVRLIDPPCDSEALAGETDAEVAPLQVPHWLLQVPFRTLKVEVVEATFICSKGPFAAASMALPSVMFPESPRHAHPVSVA